MAISYISSATGTNTATLGSHAAGDIIVVFAYRDGSTAVPTVPAGFTTARGGTGSASCSAVLAWKTAESGSETIGTWTNATSVIASVYRGAAGIGGTNITGANSTTISYPAVTMNVTDGTSWVGGAAGHRSTNVAIETAPTRMTNRTSVSDAIDEAAWHDTNGGVSSWSATSASVGGTSSGYRAITFEILATAAPILTTANVELVSATSGSPSVVTSQANGTIYLVVVPKDDMPSIAQIKTGKQSSGAAAVSAKSLAVTASGKNTLSTVSGLTTDVTYDFWFAHENSIGDSNAIKATFKPVAYPDYTPTWKTPGTVTGVWTNGDNVKANDGNYATAVTTGWVKSGETIRFSDFNFNLPVGINITSIDIAVKGYYTSDVAADYDSRPIVFMKDQTKGVGSTSGVDWPATLSYISKTDELVVVRLAMTAAEGGVALSSWTVAEFNNSSTGVVWNALGTTSNYPDGGTVSMFVDYFAIRINDTPPPPPPKTTMTALFWSFP